MPRFWPAILTLGWLILAIAAAEAVMAAFSWLADDGEAAAFAVAAAVSLVIGVAAILSTKGRAFELDFREAVILVVAAWVFLPALLAVPFLLPPVDLSPVDAYFEMVSGITTTGATVMVGLDGQPPTLLLWRSTVQWMGGFGIIGLAIVILPFMRVGGLGLLRLEFSDRSEKELPRVRSVAAYLGRIYLALTLACVLVYLMLGMSLFDAVNHAMATICTGGFSTYDASFAHFDSPALEWAAIVFMLSGAVPFMAYLRLTSRRHTRERIEPQIRLLLAVAAAASLVVAVAWYQSGAAPDGFAAITKAAFNVVSVVTTTGFASADYTLWGPFAAGCFFVLTFLGGCTGSTSGGIKMFRLYIMGQMIRQAIARSLFPHAVHPARYGARTLSEEDQNAAAIFVFLFLVAVVALAIALSATGLDAITAMSGAATALANVGPGLGAIIGPAGNFAALTDVQKLLLCAGMILGRLEILTVLVLFMPSFYR